MRTLDDLMARAQEARHVLVAFVPCGCGWRARWEDRDRRRDRPAYPWQEKHFSGKWMYGGPTYATFQEMVDGEFTRLGTRARFGFGKVEMATMGAEVYP